jgi:hypothetical protein
MTVRGISYTLGGYPDEFVIFESILNGKMMQQQWPLFAYLVAMIVLISWSVNHALLERKEQMELYSYL